MNRVDESLRSIVNLHPKTFSLQDLDDELACMALIRSLPEEYSIYIISLLLDTLDKNKQQSAFMTEELNRTRHPDLLSSQDSANALKAQPSSSVQPACSSDVLGTRCTAITVARMAIHH